MTETKARGGAATADALDPGAEVKTAMTGFLK